MKDKEQTVWLVMEYCIGSASDIIEGPFAFPYLHSLTPIFRSLSVLA